MPPGARPAIGYAPDEAAIEETFVTANGSSTLKLGHARAAAMLAPAAAGLPPGGGRAVPGTKPDKQRRERERAGVDDEHRPHVDEGDRHSRTCRAYYLGRQEGRLDDRRAQRILLARQDVRSDSGPG